MGICRDLGTGGSSEKEYWDYSKDVIDTVTDKGIEGIFTTGNHEMEEGNYLFSENSVSMNTCMFR